MQLEVLLPAAELVAVLLLATPAPTLASARVDSLCWLMARGTAWLVEPSPEPSTTQAHVESPDAVRALIAARLSEVSDRPVA
jgi:hypothetical protein